jgi:hypothetical protein
MQKFARGVLDKELSEKVKVEDPHENFLDFRFLLTEGSESLAVKLHGSKASLESASSAVVLAEFNYARAQLNGEGELFDEFMKTRKLALQENSSKETEHLERRADAIEANLYVCKHCPIWVRARCSI